MTGGRFELSRCRGDASRVAAPMAHLELPRRGEGNLGGGGEGGGLSDRVSLHRGCSAAKGLTVGSNGGLHGDDRAGGAVHDRGHHRGFLSVVVVLRRRVETEG